MDDYRPIYKDNDTPGCTDQWSMIHSELIDLARSLDFEPESLVRVGPETNYLSHVLPRLIDERIYQMRYATEGLDYVPMGRGLGRYPNPPFKQHRDYRSGSKSIGLNHLVLFHKKGTNNCQVCGGGACAGKYTRMDYYTFYPTGEIFVWTDPLFMNGFLPVDPRDPNQPEGSPLIVKWICKPCWTELEEIGRNRVTRYERRYSRLRFCFKPSGRSRVLIDRRIWEPGTYPDDRRDGCSRRANDPQYAVAYALAELTNRPRSTPPPPQLPVQM